MEHKESCKGLCSHHNLKVFNNWIIQSMISLQISLHCRKILANCFQKKISFHIHPPCFIFMLTFFTRYSIYKAMFIGCTLRRLTAGKHMDCSKTMAERTEGQRSNRLKFHWKISLGTNSWKYCRPKITTLMMCLVFSAKLLVLFVSREGKAMPFSISWWHLLQVCQNRTLNIPYIIGQGKESQRTQLLWIYWMVLIFPF